MTLWRALLTTAMTLVVWLVAAPAWAAAPLCDTRGATTFAPAPTLDAPMASVDVGDDDVECPREIALDAYRPGRAPSPELDTPGDDALLAPSVVLPARVLVTIAPPHGDVGSARLGIRSGVERPPRLASRVAARA